MKNCLLGISSSQRAITLEGILEQKDFSRSSFLGYPLLQHALLDPYFNVKKIGVDANWLYHGFFEGAVNGYNPLQSSCYFAHNSVLETWLKNPYVDSRSLNAGEHLVYEILSLVHDWFHNWTYRVIEKNFPSGFGRNAITADNFEDFVFIHILSEVVARLGQDYWFLCESELNSFVNVGSIIAPIFTNYREGYLEELRKFNPDFSVQSKDFFWSYLQVTSTGEFEGFDSEDFDRSPALHHWMHHELEISESLRLYTRQWFSFLSNGNVIPSDKVLLAPCDQTEWRKKLSGVVQEALWAEVKLGQRQLLPALPETSWTAQGMSDIDFRFVNIGALKEDYVYSAKRNVRVTDSFEYFYRQFVSRHAFLECPQEVLALLPTVKRYQDMDLLFYLFRNVPLISQDKSEVYDLYFLN